MMKQIMINMKQRRAENKKSLYFKDSVCRKSPIPGCFLLFYFQFLCRCIRDFAPIPHFLFGAQKGSEKSIGGFAAYCFFCLKLWFSDKLSLYFKDCRCLRIFLLSAALTLLSGCTVFDVSLEGLLHPPKLTEVQTAVYDALKLSAGEQIELVYPASGEYRSAFVFYNLDEEKTEEAIVFYREKNLSENGESGLRMSFLDQNDGVWTSVTDRPMAGTQIESISFYNFNGKVSIGVASSVLAQNEKSLSLLGYSGGRVEEQFKTSFSFMERCDFDNDGFDELFYVSYDTVMGYSHARILGAANNEETSAPETLSTVPLYPDVSSVQRLTRQKLNENESLLYLDYVKGDSSFGTQILLSYKNNLIQVSSDNFSRRSNAFTPVLYSTDIDEDGRIEIPVTTAFIGYESRAFSEQLYAVEWYCVDEENNNAVTKKYTTYISAGGEYVFYVPVRWQGLVTVEKQPNSDTVSFVKYDSDSLVLLSVCVSEELPKGEGWKNFEGSIYVNNSDSSDPMILTDDELENSLWVRQGILN